jgi:hypothetical protein
MLLRRALLLPCPLLPSLASAATRQPVYRWENPLADSDGLVKRQIGYHPEFGGCETGTTCREACGAAFEECKSTTDLALFCYNPTVEQKCCSDGSGSTFPDEPDMRHQEMLTRPSRSLRSRILLRDRQEEDLVLSRCESPHAPLISSHLT